MKTQRTSPRYAPEVRERAVRMVFEHAAKHASQWAANTSIAGKINTAVFERWHHE
jgi:transposase-like protein